MKNENKGTAMKNENNDNTRDQILATHGCELLPAAFGRAAIRVKPQFQRGFPLDNRRIDACIADMRAAGISTFGLLRM